MQKNRILNYKVQIIGSCYATSSVAIGIIGASIVLNNPELAKYGTYFLIAIFSSFLALLVLSTFLIDHEKIYAAPLTEIQKSDWIWCHSALITFTFINEILSFGTILFLLYLPGQNKDINLPLTGTALGLIFLLTYYFDYLIALQFGQDYSSFRDLTSVIGASSLSYLALRMIPDKNQRSETFLAISVRMARRSLRIAGAELVNLNKLALAIRISARFPINQISEGDKKKILQFLSQLPSIEGIGSVSDEIVLNSKWPIDMNPIVSSLHDQFSIRDIIALTIAVVGVTISFLGGQLGKAVLNSPTLVFEIPLILITLAILYGVYYISGKIRSDDLELWKLYRDRKYLSRNKEQKVSQKANDVRKSA